MLTTNLTSVVLNCEGVYANMQNKMPKTDSADRKEEAKYESKSNLNTEEWTNPLAKAAACLHKTIYLCKDSSTPSIIELECYETALLSLAYTEMEKNDYAGALDTCLVMLGDYKTTTPTTRKQATCRLYTAEALCHLGRKDGALVTLFGSVDVDETKLRAESNSSESPLKWLVQGFSVNVRRKVKDTESSAQVDSHAAHVKRLFDKRVELYQLLTKGDTEGASALLRCGDRDTY